MTVARIGRGVAIGIAYVAAVVWITWPLAPNAASHVVAAVPMMDLLYSMWAMAWTSTTLVTAPSTLGDAPIYHPAPDAFFYGPSAFGGLPLFAPVYWITGNPVMATNVAYMGGIALTACAMHLVVVHWTRSHLAGVIGGGVVLTNPWLVHFFGPATPHIVALEWMPLLALVAAVPAARLAAVAPLVALVVIQSLTDPVYVAPAVFGPLATLAALRLLRRETRAAGLRLVAALAISAAALAPLYAAYLGVRRENPQLEKQSAWPSVPSPVHVPFDLLHGFGPAVLPPATLTLIGVGLLARAWRRRRGDADAPIDAGWSTGALWAGVGIAMSLASVATADGGSMRTPVGLLLDLVGFRALRVPVRLGAAGLIGIAILAGMATAEIRRWLRATVRPPALAGLAGVAVAVAVLVPLVQAWGYGRLAGTDWKWTPAMVKLEPLAPPPPDLLHALSAIPGPILELPIPDDPLLGPMGQARAMYASIYHRRPLLNGYSSYYPRLFPQRMTAARMLPSSGMLAMLTRLTGLAGIWVHAAQLPRSEREQWLALGDDRRDIRLVARVGDDLVFAVGDLALTAPPADPYREGP